MALEVRAHLRTGRPAGPPRLEGLRRELADPGHVADQRPHLLGRRVHPDRHLDAFTPRSPAAWRRDRSALRWLLLRSAGSGRRGSAAPPRSRACSRSRRAAGRPGHRRTSRSRPRSAWPGRPRRSRSPPPTCRRGDLARVGAGDLDLPAHLDELVPHHLVGDQRLAERLALAAVRRGQLQRAGGDAVGVHRERDPLDDELLGDLVEAGVLLADQVRGRDPHVDERQLGGVGAVPAHLAPATGRR